MATNAMVEKEARVAKSLKSIRGDDAALTQLSKKCRPYWHSLSSVVEVPPQGK
jgi:hypothetical protein